MTSLKNNLPLFKPMLAVPSPPFSSRDYIFEIKWDGYRCLAYLDSSLQLLSRNGIDMTGTFPELQEIVASINKTPVVLDGEIIILQNGKPSFNSLQARGRLMDKGKIREESARNPAVYVAFDILYQGSEELIGKPLARRKEILAGSVNASESIAISEYIAVEGEKLVDACAAMGLEGVVAKKLTSPYLPGRRSPYWKKIRNVQEADLVICGYQKGRGGRVLGSLVLGGYEGERLIYQGKVGTGFNRAEEKRLLDKLQSLAAPRQVQGVPAQEQRKTTWVVPRLVCSVHYLSLTREGYLRHPVYKGLRPDKAPAECNTLTGPKEAGSSQNDKGNSN